MRLFQKYALEFYGSVVNTTVRFSNMSGYRYLKDKFAISLWLKPSASQRNQNIYPFSFYGQFAVRVAYGGVPNLGFIYRYDWMDAYHYNSLNLGIDICDGKWHHIVVIKDESVIVYVLDNVIVYSGNVVGDVKIVQNNVNSIYVGAWHDSYGHFDGRIGEVRVYNRPLTVEEVQWLYRGGHIVDGLVFWLYPDEESVTLDSDGQTVLSITEKVNGYVGTAYNGVKLVDGKDVDEAKSKGKRYIIVRKV